MHGAPVRQPHHIRHIRSIERIQHKLTMINCNGRSTSYTDRLTHLGIPSLHSRLWFLSFTFVCKCFYGLHDIPVLNVLSINCRRSEGIYFNHLFARTDAFSLVKFFYSDKNQQEGHAKNKKIKKYRKTNKKQNYI